MPINDPFFIKSSGKRATSTPNASQKRKKRPQKHRDDNSDSDQPVNALDDFDLEDQDQNISSDDDEKETAAEKRVRLAKQYLQKIERDLESKRDEIDAAEIDKDLIAERLRVDGLEATGHLHRSIAKKVANMDLSTSIARILRGHQSSVTALTVAKCGKEHFLFTASKDKRIIKWSLPECRKVCIVKGFHKKSNEKQGHSKEILCLASSSDGKFLASGGRDNLVHIWNIETMEHVHYFKHHKDAITGLCFRKGVNQLYSAACDRMVKVWNIDELSYVETLFGHQDPITSIDTLSKERCITSGGRDRTVRLWKIVEESQLVFRSGGTSTKKIPPEYGTPVLESSIDVVALVNEELFISGGDNGTLSLWNVQRKKPIYILPYAHGVCLSGSEGGMEVRLPNWIVSLAAVPYSDLFASGSSDGNIHLWCIDSGFKHFSKVNSISVNGFVNSLYFFIPRESEATTTDVPGLQLIACIGQEHKLGRWRKIQNSKNSTLIIQL